MKIGREENIEKEEERNIKEGEKEKIPSRLWEHVLIFPHL